MKTDNRISYQGIRWPERGGIATGVRVHHRAPHLHCVCVCVCVRLTLGVNGVSMQAACKCVARARTPAEQHLMPERLATSINFRSVPSLELKLLDASLRAVQW